MYIRLFCCLRIEKIVFTNFHEMPTNFSIVLYSASTRVQSIRECVKVYRCATPYNGARIELKWNHITDYNMVIAILLKKKTFWETTNNNQ